MIKEVKLVEASVTALDPKKFYILEFDSTSISQADARLLVEELRQRKIEGVGVIIKDAKRMKVIEVVKK